LIETRRRFAEPRAKRTELPLEYIESLKKLAALDWPPRIEAAPVSTRRPGSRPGRQDHAEIAFAEST